MEHESKSIEIIREMRSVIAEAEAIGPWIDGHLLKNKRTKYVKKDGSVSYYPTLPILQYRVGPGKRRSKRIPLERVAEIEQLIRDGARFKALMARYTELAARLSLDVKKKNLIPAFPAPRMVRVQAVLDELSAAAAAAGPAGLPEGAGTLDRRLAEAARGDMADLYGGVLGVLGRINLHGVPDGYREVTVCSWFGHASFRCAYYGPDPSGASRQVRRRLKREKENGGRRRKNGVFPRKGCAPCAYPLLDALEVRDGMTAALGDAVQRAGVMAGSFAEGASMLKLFLGVTMSVPTFRRRLLAAGRRALQAQEFPLLRLLTPHLPAWLLASTTATLPTLYIMLGGRGVPCVRKDTEGVRGKGADGKAGTREVKVAIVGTYRRLNRHGRPVRDPGCESHIVSHCQASEFGPLLRKLANSRGYGRGGFRVQIVGDGAEWIANIVRDAFPGQHVIFTNDFYHACEYLHAFVTLAEADPDTAARIYRRTRSLLYRFGADTLVRHLKRRYAPLGDGHAAWEKLAYIESRAEHMRYGEYRKQGLFIGSGPVEAACRTDVARRCKQAGMHWRHHNAAAICALTARFRSHLPAA